MFRFTIRELVLVTAVVALAVGWWLNSQQDAAEKRALEAKIAHLRTDAETAWNRFHAMELCFNQAREELKVVWRFVPTEQVSDVGKEALQARRRIDSPSKSERRTTNP